MKLVSSGETFWIFCHPELVEGSHFLFGDFFTVFEVTVVFLFEVTGFFVFLAAGIERKIRDKQYNHLFYAKSPRLYNQGVGPIVEYRDL